MLFCCAATTRVVFSLMTGPRLVNETRAIALVEVGMQANQLASEVGMQANQLASQLQTFLFLILQ